MSTARRPAVAPHHRTRAIDTPAGTATHRADRPRLADGALAPLLLGRRFDDVIFRLDIAAKDLTLAAKGVQDRLLSAVDGRTGRARDPALDQLAREAFLALSSDWAFMVSKGSAVDYARSRAAVHTGRFDELATLLDADDRVKAAALVTALRHQDAPFGHLDARALTTVLDRRHHRYRRHRHRPDRCW